MGQVTLSLYRQDIGTNAEVAFWQSASNIVTLDPCHYVPEITVGSGVPDVYADIVCCHVVRVMWSADTNTFYMLEWSNDLQNWYQTNVRIKGCAGNVQATLPATNQLFVMLKALP
jgi:hypothetical protein